MSRKDANNGDLKVGYGSFWPKRWTLQCSCLYRADIHRGMIEEYGIASESAFP